MAERFLMCLMTNRCKCKPLRQDTKDFFGMGAIVVAFKHMSAKVLLREIKNPT